MGTLAGTWTLRHLDTWSLGYLDTSAPGHLETWTIGILDTWRPEQLETWTAKQLETCTPGHQDTWTSGHLDTRTPGHLKTVTLTHLDTWTPFMTYLSPQVEEAQGGDPVLYGRHNDVLLRGKYPVRKHKYIKIYFIVKQYFRVNILRCACMRFLVINSFG